MHASVDIYSGFLGLERKSCPNLVRVVLGALVLYSAPVKALAGTVSYFGESIFHPGAALGVEWKAAGGETHSLVFGGDGGFYVHPQNHTAAFIQGTVGYRIISSFGLAGSLMVGAGYLHTFLGGPVYDEGGQQALDLGRPNFMPSISIEGSWSVTRVGDLPVAPFLRVTVFGQTPYNNGILGRAALVMGARFG